jgi:hypothetical protein
MTTFKGTQEVAPGLYLNLKRFRLKSVEKAGALPGVESETYYRVPMLVWLATAPLLGLVFVIFFLPLIGFAMVAWLLGVKIAELAARTTAEVARVVRPGWTPSMAFLSRFTPAKRDAIANKSAAPDPWTADVEKKLSETDDHARQCSVGGTGRGPGVQHQTAPAAPAGGSQCSGATG